jgi:AcrR family transcriptional regulator
MTQPDRRIRRTRKALQEALVGLIVERGYEKVTVQDLLDRADVGRSTFYAHYRDKESLFAACFDDLRADLERELDAMTVGAPPADPLRPVGVLFAHAHRHQRVYQAVCGRTGDTVGTRQLHELILGALRGHLTAAGIRLPVEVVAEFYASALVGLLVWWVRQGFLYGPVETARMCQEMIAPGVMAVLNHQLIDRPASGR